MLAVPLQGQPASDSCFLPTPAMSITLSPYLYSSLHILDAPLLWYPGIWLGPEAEGDSGSVVSPPDIGEFTLPYQKGKRVCAQVTGYPISYDTCRQAALAIYSLCAVVKHGSRHPTIHDSCCCLFDCIHDRLRRGLLYRQLPPCAKYLLMIQRVWI